MRTGSLIMGGSPRVRQPQPLKRLLEECRGRRSVEEAWHAARRLGMDPPELGSLVPRHGPEPGISAEQMAALLEHGPREYDDLERGAVPVQPVVATQLAVLLGLDEDERARLWELALGRNPVAVPGAPAPAWSGLVDDLDRLGRPAYLCDIALNRVLANAAFHGMFPWGAPDSPHPETNIMRLVWRAEARAAMADWERDWAWPLWAHVWGAYQLYPANATLQDLVHDVAADAAATPFWHGRDDPTGPAPGTRTLLHPTWGRTRLATLTAIPESLRGIAYRFVCFRPADPEEPASGPVR